MKEAPGCLVVSLAKTWAALQDAIETVDVQDKNLLATEERSKIAEVEFGTGLLLMITGRL